MISGKEPGYKAEERRRKERAYEQRQKEERADLEQQQKAEQAASEQRQRDEQAEKENIDLRLKLFGEYKNEQQTRERANSDKYDNTILTYSTGALALSLTFIKDVVPLATAHMVLMLEISWLLFVLALLLMLISFPIAQADNRKSVDFAHKYYIDKDETYYNKVGWQGKVLKYLNHLAGTLFFCGIFLTAIFVWTNLRAKTAMADKKITTTTTATTKTTTSTITTAMDGTSSAKMNPAPSAKSQTGAPAARQQSVNTPSPAPASSIARPKPAK